MNTKSGTQSTKRKRGRPAGKDRAPLSLEERRARNAQYERERRIEHAEAVTELVNASGFDPGLSFVNLLRHVCCYFREESRRPTEDSVESLRQTNYDLLQKIKQTEASLAAPTPPQSPTDEEDTCMRTRPFIYVRRVKKERVSSDSSGTSIQTTAPIQRELVVIKTEVDVKDEPAQITAHTAFTPVQIKTKGGSETMPVNNGRIPLQEKVREEKRPQKKRKIDQVKVNPVPTNVDITPATQLMQTEIELRPQENQPEADPFILGLFTEAEAKHDIVQYYINLLIEEGYNGGENPSSGIPLSEPSNEDYGVFRTTYQG